MAITSTDTTRDDVSTDVAGEFPTDWHRQAYIDGLRREQEGAKLRKDNGAFEAASAELARLTDENDPSVESTGDDKSKQTRPRPAAETRGQ